MGRSIVTPPLHKWCQGCGLVNRSTNLYDDTFFTEGRAYEVEVSLPGQHPDGFGRVCICGAGAAGCRNCAAKQKERHLGIQGTEGEGSRNGKEREKAVSVGRLGS